MFPLEKDVIHLALSYRSGLHHQSSESESGNQSLQNTRENGKHIHPEPNKTVLFFFTILHSIKKKIKYPGTKYCLKRFFNPHKNSHPHVFTCLITYYIEK